jgi:hypothetical protein
MMRELEEHKDSPANVCGRGEADMCLNLKLCVLYLCDRKNRVVHYYIGLRSYKFFPCGGAWVEFLCPLRVKHRGE